jgi:hypothetical protein
VPVGKSAMPTIIATTTTRHQPQPVRCSRCTAGGIGAGLPAAGPTTRRSTTSKRQPCGCNQTAVELPLGVLAAGCCSTGSTVASVGGESW